MKVLEVGGVPVTIIAEKCGTPVYIYDEAKIEKQIEDYRKFFVSSSFDTDIVYASKAFTCKAMIEKLAAEGICVDVVSGGELYIAQQGGMPMEKIYFHGNNKTAAELEQALDAGCGTVVLDNIAECNILTELAEDKKCSINVMLRINPGVEAHTHPDVIPFSTAQFTTYLAILSSSIALEYSITVTNAASSTLTLSIMLGVALIFVPVVAAYQLWLYRTFSHKVTDKELNQHNAYYYFECIPLIKLGLPVPKNNEEK